MIERIRLINWTSHKDTEIKFGKSNILVGFIGSGKSSVVEAISYLLYGTFPSLRERELSIKDVIRRGEKKAILEGEFLIDGKRYLIRREVKSNSSSTAKLYIDGKLITESTSLINEYMEKETGIDAKAFSNTLYSSQNRLEEIVELSPSERRKLIDELINLESLERAHKNAIKLSNRVGRELRIYLEQMPSSDIDRMEEEIEKIQENIAIEKKRVEEEKKRLESLIKERKEVEEVFMKEKEKMEEKRKLLEEKKKIEGIIESLREYENKESEISLIEKELEEKRLELKKVEKLENELNGKLRGFIEKISSLAVKIKEGINKRKEKEELEKRIREIRLKDKNALENERKEKEGELAELRSKIKEAINGINQIKGVEKKCPVCMRELSEGEAEKIKDHWRKEIEASRKRIEELKRELEEIEAKIREEERKEKELYSLKRRMENIKIIDIESLGNEKANYMKEKEEIEKRIKEVESKRNKLLRETEEMMQKLKFAKDVEKKKELLKRARKKREELEESINKLKVNEDLLKEKEKELRDLYSIIGEKRGYLNNIIKVINERERLLHEKQKALDERKKIKERVEKLSVINEDINIAKAVIEEVQQKARKSLLESINMSLNALWSLLYPYRDYIEVKVKAEENSYVFLANDGRDWVEIDRVFSGGEKSIFVLSLRLAIASVVMNRLSFIILDEPTHNLDDKAVERLSEVIDKELPSMIGQFIIVTHDERLKNIENGKIFYFERSKEGNEPTLVKEV